VGEYVATVAPEVRAQGLAAADQRSDLYSLCACLNHLFLGQNDDLSRQAAERLERGLANEPERRCTMRDLEAALSELLGESVPLPPPPPARFWTEDQIINFHDSGYRIVSRLGSGGVGTTFNRVVHLYLLRELNKVNAHLVFVYFIGDKDVNGPNSEAEWKSALTVAKGVIGLGERHQLSKYIGEVFVDVRDLENGR